MSSSTDAMYNARSRYIHQMFRIHFSSSKVLEVKRSEYLMSSSLLEELYKHTDSPFGDITSNEITLTLFNDKGIFNPVNVDSEYYGLIKKGIKIEAFIKPDGIDDWDQVGTYYVNDWVTSTTGTTADVTANDMLHTVLNGPVPQISVYRNIHFKDFIELYFRHFGLAVSVDEAIDYIIPYAYTCEYSDNKSFLLDLMKSALADCFCDHNGNIRILSKLSARVTRAKFTDSDQIIDVTVKQSITTNYDSATVSCYKCQESPEQTVIDLADLSVVPGLNSTGKLATSEYPILSIRSVKVNGAENVSVRNFSASASDFECTLQSTTNASVSISAVGTSLVSTKMSFGEALETPLIVDSLLVQNEDRAELIKNYIEAYVKANMPIVELTVRGNPKIQLGDKIQIDSNRYKVQYSGVVTRVSYEYIGNLTCKMLLADASVIKEV